MEHEPKPSAATFLKEQPTYRSERGRLKALIAVSSLHFINDLHPTLLPTFLPEIVKRLDLSMGKAGFLSTLFGILNLVVQPLAGHLADKLNTPSFALWAPLLTAIGAYLIPIAPNYGIAMLFVAMLGVGTAAFHPQGHGLTGVAGGSRNLGSYLAVFAAAGTLGSALSPIYGVFLLRMLGPRLMPFAVLFVLTAVLAARALLPKRQVEGGENEAKPDFARTDSAPTQRAGFFSGIASVLVVCLPLILISIVRDSTSQGIRVFLPLLVTGRGGSLELGGSILFFFTAAGSVANLFGGRLADRFGKTRVIFVMLLLSPFFLFPAVRLGGPASIVLFVLGGACIAATNPITLAMAQENVPGARSTASSLVMGVSWGIANIVASPIGSLADRIGLERALSIVALSPLLVVAALAVNHFRPKTKPKPQ